MSAISGLASLPQSALRNTLQELSEVDVRKLRKTCKQILRSPDLYSRETVAVCQVVASL